MNRLSHRRGVFSARMIVIFFVGSLLFYGVEQFSAGSVSAAIYQAEGVNGQVSAPEETPELPAAEEPVTTEHSGEDHLEGSEHGGGSGHGSHVAPLLLMLSLILALAKIAGDIFVRIGLPAVLGELSIGVVLGNFELITGLAWFDFLHPSTDQGFVNPYAVGAVLEMMSEIGVLILLFEVGLESKIHEMLRVGGSSFLVAVMGVAAPIALGWGVGWFLIPEAGWQVHLFLGAVLCATSVGITARVLKDLGLSKTKEAKIILGAAVIDDILGLIVLAIAQGIISTGKVDAMNVMSVFGLAIGFLVGAILLGSPFFIKPLFAVANRLHGGGLLVAATLIICFVFSYMAEQAGLAPIVGAFAAGMVLEHVHYQSLEGKEGHRLEAVIEPIGAVLMPVFFIQMGINVNLGSFNDPAVWGLATALTVAAILGKQVCTFGVLEKGLNRFSIGLGMIPRGEVGLIFAAVGKSLRMPDGTEVISDSTFSAIVVMVMITTMLTPPLLTWSFKKQPPHPTEEGEINFDNIADEGSPI